MARKTQKGANSMHRQTVAELGIVGLSQESNDARKAQSGGRVLLGIERGIEPSLHQRTAVLDCGYSRLSLMPLEIVFARLGSGHCGFYPLQPLSIHHCSWRVVLRL